MAIKAGVNYVPPKLTYEWVRDLLEIACRDTRKTMPNYKTQKEFIRVALDNAHKTHPDFTLTKIERDDAKEDVAYETLVALLTNKKG